MSTSSFSVQLSGVLFLVLVNLAQAQSYEQTVLNDGPVGYWRLDDPIGSLSTTNLGTQGPALDGTYSNVTLGEQSNFPQLGTSARFSGASSYVDLANNISTWLNRTASLEFWIKTTQSGFGTWDAPAVAGTDSNGTGFDLFWGTNSGGRIGVRRGDGAGSAALTPNPINDDTWHQLVLTREHSTGLLLTYLDGNPNPVGMFDDVDNLDAIDRPYDRLGAFNFVPGPAQDLEATLDEIAIYDYVLDGTQVEAHYLAATIPEPSTLVLSILGMIGLGVYRRRVAA